MSGALLGISAVGGIAQQALQSTGLMPAWIRAPRQIGDANSKGGAIIPDVTIEESHSDRLTVTQHPVAWGLSVSDHAYKMPATVTMRLGFSNANVVGAITQGAIGGFASGGIGGALGGGFSALKDSFTEQRAKSIYKKLVDLQFDKEAWNKGEITLRPFSLKTGKRDYENMVITELSLRTDRTSEYSLMIECHMQEVFIVKTKTTTQPAQTDQGNPQKTAGPGDQSSKQPGAGGPTNSIFKDLGVGGVLKGILPTPGVPGGAPTVARL